MSFSTILTNQIGEWVRTLLKFSYRHMTHSCYLLCRPYLSVGSLIQWSVCAHFKSFGPVNTPQVFWKCRQRARTPSMDPSSVLWEPLHLLFSVVRTFFQHFSLPRTILIVQVTTSSLAINLLNTRLFCYIFLLSCTKSCLFC